MSRHVRRFQNRRPTGIAGHDAQVPATKSTKALVAAVLTLAGLLGIHLTDGTAQLVVAIVQLVAVTYGVWRAYNAPKVSSSGQGVGEFL
jgi:hypothetical protein